MLRLKADGAALGQCRAVGAGAAAAVVTAVALYAGFSGVALQAAAACGVNALYCKTQLTGLAFVKYPTVVIAVAVLGLDALLDTVTYLVCGAEIKRGALNLVNGA